MSAVAQGWGEFVGETSTMAYPKDLYEELIDEIAIASDLHLDERDFTPENIAVTSAVLTNLAEVFRVEDPNEPVIKKDILNIDGDFLEFYRTYGSPEEIITTIMNSGLNRIMNKWKAEVQNPRSTLKEIVLEIGNHDWDMVAMNKTFNPYGIRVCKNLHLEAKWEDHTQQMLITHGDNFVGLFERFVYMWQRNQLYFPDKWIPILNDLGDSIRTAKYIPQPVKTKITSNAKGHEKKLRRQEQDLTVVGHTHEEAVTERFINTGFWDKEKGILTYVIIKKGEDRLEANLHYVFVEPREM